MKKYYIEYEAERQTFISVKSLSSSCEIELEEHEAPKCKAVINEIKKNLYETTGKKYDTINITSYSRM